MIQKCIPTSRIMLDKRAQILLKTLVENYINDGQPVGSRTLSERSGLDLSPATIRNAMADLESMGFIASPHTSAGRIPTQRGYRFFVDTLLTFVDILLNFLYMCFSFFLFKNRSCFLIEI